MGVSPALLHAGRPCQGTRVLLRSHLVRPHVTVWALFVFAWGRALLGLVVGVFARWVAGVWCLRLGCVRLLVFACFGVGAPVGWRGQCGPAASAPLAWLVFTLWRGLEKRVRGSACPMGGGRPGRGGTWLSRPI